MKRQKILVIVLAVLFALMLAAYFAVIRPVFGEKDGGDVTDVPETESGESLGTSNRFFMFQSLSREDIASVEVDNKYGGFTFYKDSEGKFKIKGYDNVTYDEKLFASLLNVSAYTLSKTKVGSNLSDEKLGEYGLTEPQASWTVTSGSGESFRVFVGDKLLTGGGYYCMFEGRASVYVLGIDVEETVLVPIEIYVTPVLCAGISKDDYYKTDKFTVYKDGQELLRIRLQDKDKQRNPDALAENVMDYPTAYYPNSTLYYEIIYSYMSFTADSCYKLGAGAEDIAAVGLSEPAHRITFEYNRASYVLAFSEKTDDGYYYAVSNLYPNVIGKVSADKLYYLEYDLIDWIDSYVFQQYITNLSSLTVKGPGTDVTFALAHGTDEKGNAVLKVSAPGVGTLSQEQTANFRQYYKSFLAIAIQDYYYSDEYCKLSREEMEALAADEANAFLTVSYTTNSGDTGTLGFYRYSTRHSLVTVNGVGEFYVLTDIVQKIENDTLRVLNGETVTAFDKN